MENSSAHYSPYFLIDDFDLSFEAFEDHLKRDFGLDFPGLRKDQANSDNNKEFNKFIDAVVNAGKNLLDEEYPPDDDLHHFYEELIKGMVPDKNAMEHIHFHLGHPSKKKKATTPRFLIEFHIENRIYKENNPLLQLACDMIPYLNTAQTPQRLVGAMLTFGNAEVIWIDNFIPGEALERDDVEKYSFDWQWFVLKSVIEHRKQGQALKDFHPAGYLSLCKFYIFLRGLIKIISV